MAEKHWNVDFHYPGRRYSMVVTADTIAGAIARGKMVLTGGKITPPLGNPTKIEATRSFTEAERRINPDAQKD